MPYELHVLTGGYALDAVSDAERKEFERHLQHCPACDAEVRGLRETAARLARTCAMTPPARMEQQVLAATYRTRQLLPLAADRPRPIPRIPRIARIARVVRIPRVAHIARVPSISRVARF